LENRAPAVRGAELNMCLQDACKLLAYRTRQLSYVIAIYRSLTNTALDLWAALALWTKNFTSHSSQFKIIENGADRHIIICDLLLVCH